MRISSHFAILMLLYLTANFCMGLDNVTDRPISPFDFDVDNSRIVQIIKPESTEDYVEDLVQPIDFSQMGIDDFFHRFNHKLYVQEVLRYGGLRTHLLSFCDEGVASEQGADFYHSLFRIFTRRVKATPCIDAEDLCVFLERLPNILSYLYLPQMRIKHPQVVVKDMLCSELNKNFDLFQEHPEAFLDKLSKDVCARVLHYDMPIKGEVDNTKLRNVTIKLIDSCLAKVAWSPPYDKEIWYSFKHILKSIMQLKMNHIIEDTDDIKDLIDTAVMRFCHNINVIGGKFSMDFYEAVREDLQSHIVGLDDFEEELEVLSTLREILQATMIENVGRAKAREKFGLIT